MALTIMSIALLKTVQTIKESKEQERLFNLDINSLASSMIFVDDLIKDSVLNYRILNIDHDDNYFMSQKAELTMTAEVLKEVLGKLSPLIYKKLCLLYDKKTLEDIIYKKISIAVLEVKIEVNGSYNS